MLYYFIFKSFHKDLLMFMTDGAPLLFKILKIIHCSIIWPSFGFVITVKICIVFPAICGGQSIKINTC